MLSKETTTEPDAIEKIFCVPFEKLEQYPMDNEIENIFLFLLMADPDKKLNTEKPFLYKVIEKRVQYCFNYAINDARLIMILCILAVSPGCAVMYLTYLQYYCKNKSKKTLTIEDLGNIFPRGFPCEDDLHKLWDAQKVKPNRGGSDNLLDYATAMQSIMF